MPLFLVESNLDSRDQLESVRIRFIEAAAAAGARLVESRATAEGERLFLIFEHHYEPQLRDAVRPVDPTADLAEVRLVGATVEEVRSNGGGNFLTEWDFPEDLTMDTYLARKAEKSPLYDQIPEVDFKRTYVREDMDKCLCFYDADCAEDVILARKIVDTPVDRIAELE